MVIGSDCPTGTHGQVAQSSRRLRRRFLATTADNRIGPDAGTSPRREAYSSETQAMSRSSTRQVASSTKPIRVKTAVCISPKAFERIGACCLKEGLTQSELIELLVNQHLRGYYVAVQHGASLKDSGNQPISTIPTVPNDRPIEVIPINPNGENAA